METVDNIKNLYDTSKKMGAPEAHMLIAKPFKDEKASAVLSVYHELKPSHLVLDELCNWLEKHKYDTLPGHVVSNKIIELTEDLSFLNED